MKNYGIAKFLFISVPLLFGGCLSTGIAAERPNIVLILADDMGFDEVSANNEKIGKMKTPCIDRLMDQGMHFTDAHSGSAVCTPTRYGLLTGRYCWRSVLKREVLWEWGRPLIEKGRLTLAGLLKKQGYRTGMVGKWHLGMDWYDAEGNLANRNVKLQDTYFRGKGLARKMKAVGKRIDFTRPVTGGPTSNGFDDYFGVDVPNFPPYAWILNDRVQGSPSVQKTKDVYGHPGPMVPGWKQDRILPELTRRAGEWITRQGKSGKPFFLYFPLTSPHTPIAPSKAFLGKSGISKYADFVMETDWAVGEIMRVLERENLADNTLLFFTTDNGTSPTANFRHLEKHGVDLHNHFSGHKTMIQEGGHRIPLVVRWPGRVKAGSVCARTVCLTDFMATFADLLSTPLPDNAGEDSVSILSLLLGKEDSFPGRPPVVHHDYRGRFAIRDGRWKMYQDGLLFDLEKDIKERHNVAARHPEIVKRLSAVLKKYRSEGHSRPMGK